MTQVPPTMEDLRECFASGTPLTRKLPARLPTKPGIEYALHRFLLAWQHTRRLGPDEMVLLRQLVRWSEGSSLFTGNPPPSLLPLLPMFGLVLEGGGRIRASAYSPTWLGEIAECDEPPVKRTLNEDFDAEPWLESIKGHSSWRSFAQKEAAWTVLQTPAGGTRAIVLPTGAGKSLCFQLLPRFDARLTVVIVPTIALAIDQQTIAAELLEKLPDVNPMYFASDTNPEQTVIALKEGRCRLLFTSPESCVSGRLRPVLAEAAKEGRFGNLVIDECHLIETWGAQFRVEFQLLAALRRQWLGLSGGALRTYLFSATMTSDCRELLLHMFSEEGNEASLICQRLRPEMNCFHRHFAHAIDRDTALIDAIHHLPRPAILYVTKVEDAENYTHRIRAEFGFQRVACFHGQTRRTDRERLLRQWKENEIDLMVATSAFGVGVDKPDVRAVVHACYPENLDRYYQEIGRTGRDGFSSSCLFLPTSDDAKIAKNLVVKPMSKEMMQERWEALFRDHRSPLRNAQEETVPHCYLLPLASKRRGLVGTFTYDENVRWNKRLVLQLHRAGRLELLDVRYEVPIEAPDDDPEEWAEVRVLDFPPDTHELAKYVGAERDAELKQFFAGFEQVAELLKGGRCVARVLADLYDMTSGERVCGGCPYCRKHGLEKGDCLPLTVFASATGLHEGGIVLECYDVAKESDDFIDLMHKAVLRKDVRHFLVPKINLRRVLNLFREAMPSESPKLYRVDPLDRQTVIATPVEETLGFLHIREANLRAFALAQGRKSVHFFCCVAEPLDAYDRPLHVNEACNLYHSPETWLHAD